MSRCRNTTSLIRFVIGIGLISAVGGLESAHAVPQGVPATPAGTANTDGERDRERDRDRGAGAGVAEAILALTGWVRAFQTPLFDEPEASIPLPDTPAVCVLLRQRGRLVGEGIDDSGDDRMVRRAAGKAMAGALNDRVISEIPASMQASIGEQLTVQLELAGRLEPVPGGRFDRAGESIDPGVHGVAMRRGDTMAWRFPAQMLAEGTAAGVEQQIRQLALELDLPAGEELGELVSGRDVSLYRFETIHFVVPVGSSTPNVLRRGDSLVYAGAVLRDDALRLANGVASHLMARCMRFSAGSPDEPENNASAAGPFIVAVADRWRANTPLPPVQPADERNTLLTMAALARYAGHSGVDVGASARAREFVRDFLETYDFSGDGVSADIVALRVRLLHAWSELREPVSRAKWEDAHDALRQVVAGRTERLPPVTQAMVASAASATLRLSSPPIPAERVRELIQTAIRSVGEPELPTLLPWVGWAAMEYASATGDRMPEGEALDRTCEFVMASRIGSGERPGPLELMGGIDLVGREGSPRADAHSTRPASYVVRALRDHPPASVDLVDAYAFRQGTIRFLRQLSVREEIVWSSPGAPRTVGGVRQALWDGDLPLPAQALALIIALDVAG
jgi:hypothetical protein